MEEKNISEDRFKKPKSDGIKGEMVNFMSDNGPLILPILPLRGTLVFPYMVVNLDVGRDRSIRAIDEAMKHPDQLIFLSMQFSSQVDEPLPEDINVVGTVAQIRQILKLPGGTIRILVEGLYRAQAMDYPQIDPYMTVSVTPCAERVLVSDLELEALCRTLGNSFEEFVQNTKRISPDVLAIVTNIEDDSLRYADTIASYLNFKLTDRQAILDELDVYKRITMMIHLIDRELEIAQLEKKISGKVRQQMEKSQKEYYLREQIKAIQHELGDKEDRIAEVEELRAKIDEAKLPSEVVKKLNEELDRLSKMPPMVAEGMVIRNYIDTVLELPWTKTSEDSLDLKKVKHILDEDHFGLDDAKERILEYLASCRLTNSMKGPILCLVGPPGVGKTSIARSVARALDRKFIRMALGGVKDEAEIRGHRRTYIGAMPGRILQNMKLAGTKNPVFLLDEVDKLSSDFRGDPSSALLEALDPEQNNTFSDHYVELPFDLSKVMFITTANVAHNIPRPLLDRMEVIDVSSYTDEEKLKIAKNHIVAKQLKEHGIQDDQLTISDNALRAIIRNYTRESGVREMERKIAKVCRQVGRYIVEGEATPFTITEKNLKDYLGNPRYHYGKAEKKKAETGLVTGLAWTQYGGEILKIEVLILPGSGKMQITGQLGDVMKESAQAGYTFIRSLSHELKLAENMEEKQDIHIHVPEGAIPKDGPSAGISMATALASALSKRPVKAGIAMTGEITLRGCVLPVGGIKEKMLAAYREGYREIILPFDNKQDLEDIPASVMKKMEFHFVTSMKEVLDIALA